MDQLLPRVLQLARDQDLVLVNFAPLADASASAASASAADHIVRAVCLARPHWRVDWFVNGTSAARVPHQLLLLHHQDPAQLASDALAEVPRPRCITQPDRVRCDADSGCCHRGLDVVVFTKQRPMQLFALLESLMYAVAARGRLAGDGRERGTVSAQHGTRG